MVSPYYQDLDEILRNKDVTSLSHSRDVVVTKQISNAKANNENTGSNICMFRDYSCLLVKRKPFLSSTFSGYYRFFFQVF